MISILQKAKDSDLIRNYWRDVLTKDLLNRVMMPFNVSLEKHLKALKFENTQSVLNTRIIAIQGSNENSS